MNTKVNNNIVEPRSYQLYGDDIDSKQAVEPIALVGGTGPICGFNYIDVSDDTKLIISGLSNPNLETVSVSDDEEVVRTRDPRRWLSTKANESGVVVNAYTTPDGLVHIAPDILTFNFSPEGGWPRVNGEPDRAVIFALKAKHTYSDQNGIVDTPSQENFEVTWVDGTNIPFLKLINGSYQYLLDRILPDGWLDTNTESFLGLYIVGWNYDTWSKETAEPGGLPVEHYELLVRGRDIGYKLCLVPYGGVWPVTAFIHGPLENLVDRERYSMVSKDINDLKAKFETTNWVPDKSILTRMINDLAVTNDKLAKASISRDKLSDDLIDVRDYVFGSIALTIKPTGGKPTISIDSFNNFPLSVNTDLAYWGLSGGPYEGSVVNPYIYLPLYRVYPANPSEGQIMYGLVPSSVQVGMNYESTTKESVAKASNVFYESKYVPPKRVEQDNGLTIYLPAEDNINISIFGMNEDDYRATVKVYITAQFKRWIHSNDITIG